jgi:hypothetical protein
MKKIQIHGKSLYVILLSAYRSRGDNGQQSKHLSDKDL